MPPFQLLDLLKSVEVIIGLIGTAILAIIWTVNWWDKRSRQYVDDRVDATSLAGDKIVQRLAKVEKDIGRVDRDLAVVVQKLDGMPTAQQYTELKVQVAGIASTVQSMAGQVTTLYKAAMRADAADKS